MGLLSLEQDEWQVWLDFVVYALLTAASAAWLVHALAGGIGPIAAMAWHAAAWLLAGLLGWTMAEYLLHRFVLHGVQPFRRWHALHHQKPLALIATPTLWTAALFGLLVAAPAAWLLPAERASALLTGVAAAYLAYIVTHHAVHHLHGQSGWWRHRQRWHAQHHRVGAEVCYGVSVPLWDHVFGSAGPRVRQRTDATAPKPYNPVQPDLQGIAMTAPRPEWVTSSFDEANRNAPADLAALSEHRQQCVATSGWQAGVRSGAGRAWGWVMARMVTTVLVLSALTGALLLMWH